MAEKRRDFEPLPYYRWYWRDARASMRWQRLHHFARGLYRELLDECWAKGCIPDDPTLCADAIGWPAKDVAKHWAAVREMFVDIGDGLLINERMENERTDNDRLRVTRAVNGRRGGKASGEARRSKPKQNEASASTAEATGFSIEASSSSSSSEQSKSSSVGLESSSPSAALAPREARGASGFTLVKDAIASASSPRRTAS